MYQNVGHPSMPQGFSGSCLIELKSLEALVDALKLDGNVRNFSHVFYILYIFLGTFGSINKCRMCTSRN